jgi:predicted  nucleic acid-binding Zn-ribbon protein
MAEAALHQQRAEFLQHLAAVEEQLQSARDRAAYLEEQLEEVHAQLRRAEAHIRHQDSVLLNVHQLTAPRQ